VVDAKNHGRAVETLLRKLAATNKEHGSRSRQSRWARAVLRELGHRGGLKKGGKKK
jgi:hypothetical protein